MINGYLYTNGKVPRRGERLTDPNYTPHSEPPKKGDYVGVYNGDYVKVDVDTVEDFEKLISKCRANGLKFNALRTSRGGHLYFKNVGLTKNRKAQKAVCGFVCEWKFATSNDTVPIKRDDVMMEWVEGSPLNSDISTLPLWLFPEIELIKPNLPAWLPDSIPNGERDDTLFRIGCSMRAKGSPESEIYDALMSVNKGLCDPPLSSDQIRIKAQQAAKFDAGIVTGKTPVPKLAARSVADLQMKQLPPPRWIVAEMIPQGLTILASPPKFGKSWFVLDLCLSVAAGDSFLKHKTTKSGCLYLALEDSEYRMKDRVNKLTLGVLAPDTFDYVITAQTLENGLIEQLEEYIHEHPDTALIVVDTLQKVRGIPKGKETSYGNDYRELGQLKSFADKYGISVLVVHHTRKMKDDDDEFNTISGTNGISGSADTAMILSRKRFEEDTKLSITGRDVDQSQTILNFDKANYRWKVKGTVEEIEEKRITEDYENNPIVQTIQHLLEKNEQWVGTMAALIAECLDYTGTLPDRVEPDKPSTLGQKMVAYARMLNLRDRIGVEFPNPNGGKGGRKYRFYKRE
jgi:hypothetical protein